MPEFSSDPRPQPDPLADVVELLRPAPAISKLVRGAGRWRVERRRLDEPFYCAVAGGGCRLSVSDGSEITLSAGDFVLIPDSRDFSTASLTPPIPGVEDLPVAVGEGTFRLGEVDAPVNCELLVGHCAFETSDRALLVALMPDVMHVQDHPRLTALVRMIHDETRAARPARDRILVRLLEVMLIETLRSSAGAGTSPGLLRGLADPRLADALRRIHAAPGEAISVPELARTARMSRSTFFERFRREIGVAPMEYVTAWRMALARSLIRRGDMALTEIAEAVGYGSASAFSMAFSRQVGCPPGSFTARTAG